MARGGRRQGTPGVAYPNRSDLRAPKPPIVRFTGQEYGTQAAQVAQQQAAPPPPAAVPAPQQAPAPIVPPTPLDAPTERPDEPVTAGLPSGPGPGPEVLNLGQPSTTSALLASMARTSPAVAQLASYVDSGRA